MMHLYNSNFIHDRGDWRLTYLSLIFRRGELIPIVGARRNYESSIYRVWPWAF